MNLHIVTLTISLALFLYACSDTSTNTTGVSETLCNYSFELDANLQVISDSTVSINGEVYTLPKETTAINCTRESFVKWVQYGMTEAKILKDTLLTQEEIDNMTFTLLSNDCEFVFTMIKSGAIDGVRSNSMPPKTIKMNYRGVTCHEKKYVTE